MRRRFLAAALWILLWSFDQGEATTINSDVIALQLVAKDWQATPLNWTGYDPCGSFWKSIKCNGTTVTKLISNIGSIQGTLATAIGDLPNLEVLDLSNNPGLTGPIPKELGKLTNLKFLSLQGCSFWGSIPAELGPLHKLTFLALNKNELSGFIPPELGALSQVYWFDLAENSLSGPLPVSTSSNGNIGLNNLTGAKHFHLFNNSFSGGLPKELSTLPILIHLLVDNNQLTGNLPVEYGNFAKMEIMRFDNNQLEGSIPNSYGQISTLMELNARNNSLTGTVPDFSNLTKLTLLSLGLNVFDPQPVPTGLSTKLQTLELDRSNLNGSLPSALTQMPSLESLSLASNRLAGPINLTSVSPKLMLLNLADNNLTLVTGDLSGNFNLSLTGNPACTNKYQHFSEDVCSTVTMASHNDTSNPCSMTCSKPNHIVNPYYCVCGYPLVVYFQFNSPSFAEPSNERLQTLRQVLANSTHLQVEQIWMKDSVFILTRRLILSVYFFPNKTADVFDYETVVDISNVIFLHQLIGVPAEFGPYAVSRSLSPFLAFSLTSSRSSLGSGVIAGISVGAVLFTVAIVATAWYALFQKKRADKAISMPFSSWGSMGKSGSAPQLKGARYFTLQELKKATDNFSSSSEIGAGGYGKVYKGTLLTGDVVAIKRAEEGSMQGAPEFKTEIELLSRVHHRNLVNLIGFCSEQGMRGLVYEYMANGNLKDHLAGHSAALTWEKRLQIAHDSCRGLAYLHELANPPVIHRDVKSTNILLDEEFTAKVSDFGLGKLGINEGQTHVSTQVKGTMGYLDPEYYMTQQLTDRSDVYSFGVVLLELVTGRQPIVGGKHIVREVRSATEKGLLMQLVDPFLEGYQEEGVQQVVQLALRCVEEAGLERPSMSEVCRQLECILLTLLPPASPVSQSSKHATAAAAAGLYASYPSPSFPDSQSFAYSGPFPQFVEPK